MEAIKPGSAQLLKQMQSTRSALSSPTLAMAPGPFPPEPAVPQPMTKPRPNARPNKRAQSEPQVKPKGSATLPPTASKKVAQSEELAHSMENSWSGKKPEDYVEPNTFPSNTSPDPTASLPVSMLRQNGHPPPIARRPNHTYSHKPRTSHPRLESKSSSEKSLPPVADGDHYEIMDPVEDPSTPSAVPRPNKPRPKPRKRTTPESSPAITRGTNSSPPLDDDILGDENDTDYLSLMPSEPSESRPQPVTRQSNISPDVAEQLLQNLSKDQVGALIHMLQQVQTQDKGCTPTNLSSSAPESSLRGNFSECV